MGTKIGIEIGMNFNGVWKLEIGMIFNIEMDENKNNKIISEVQWFIAHDKLKYAIRLKIEYLILAINHTDAKSAVVIQSFENFNFQDSSRKRV